MGIRHLVLGVLLEGEANGYQVCGRLAKLPGVGPAIESARVYAVLAELERSGAVVAREGVRSAGRPTRWFRPTGTGREEFERWLERAAPAAEWLRRPLLARLVIAGPPDSAHVASLRGELEVRRRALGRLDGAADADDACRPIERLARDRARRQLLIEIGLLEEVLRLAAAPAPERAVSSPRKPPAAASGSR